ncbi:unnamed protein product [Linum tenue]|uniref:Phytocyanin domain-containing protein n=1 Tax=Linum tenue TaxID=586396 RepID=A0AAV0IVJ0_9ROSI|nr:unnamed protein product [Linum tenue]
MEMSKKALVLLTLICCVVVAASSAELFVGGKEGWTVPKSKDEQHHFFNDWASTNRFRVNDTLRFKYKKDSVMVVKEEEEYNKCRSSHPLFFSNNGDTSFRLDRPGLFYFISGVTGHCDHGLKMIIKVLDVEDDSTPLPTPPPSDDHPNHKSSAAASPYSATVAAAAALPLLALSLFL